jgi:hypothetical protein
MFGFKRQKPQAFADVLDRIGPAAQHMRSDGDLDVLDAQIAPAQARQPNDWLLQLLTGMMPPEGASAQKPATPPIYEASYLEDAVAPLLEAIKSVEQDAIAKELGLSANLSVKDLHTIRRTFARANHPDRLHPSQRDIATHRMTIANMLIDQRLGQKSAAK